MKLLQTDELTSILLMVMETDRLRLRRLSLDDAEFILRLLNEPSFIQNIGDRQVRTVDDARGYIVKGPITSYEKFGFGLWMVETKSPSAPIGICGLLKRDVLDDVDIGYALLPEFWSQGYALESAAAVLAYAGETLGLKRVVAVTNSNNQSSIRLLEKLGFKYERMVRLSEDAPEIKLFAATF
jgi:RimJ/RimL family protein N-acetyltransferase